jgi:hypothetical protein
MESENPEIEGKSIFSHRPDGTFTQPADGFARRHVLAGNPVYPALRRKNAALFPETLKLDRSANRRFYEFGSR